MKAWAVATVIVGSMAASAAGPAPEAPVDDPADLPFVAKLLSTDSHSVASAQFEATGIYKGSVALPPGDTAAFVFTFEDTGMQVFCGRARKVPAQLHVGDKVHVASKVMTADAVYVMQVCYLSTPSAD